MTFRNVDEFKKRLVKSGLVWSRTLLTLLSTNGQASPCLCSLNEPTFRTFLLSAVEKNGQLDELSARVTEMWTKYVLGCYFD